MHLGVSQPIRDAAVMCTQAHERPVLPFVRSANNCRSEHIHRMLLSNVAVTTERHQRIYWSDSGKKLCTKCLAFFFLLRINKSPNF